MRVCLIVNLLACQTELHHIPTAKAQVVLLIKATLFFTIRHLHHVPTAKAQVVLLIKATLFFTIRHFTPQPKLLIKATPFYHWSLAPHHPQPKAQVLKPHPLVLYHTYRMLTLSEPAAVPRPVTLPVTLLQPWCWNAAWCVRAWKAWSSHAQACRGDWV